MKINDMTRYCTIFMLPLLLSGCIGTLMWGETGYLGEAYPDIRSVPSRQEAIASRGLHGGDEKIVRGQDLKALEQEREQLSAREQALKEQGETLKVTLLPDQVESCPAGNQ